MSHAPDEPATPADHLAAVQRGEYRGDVPETFGHDPHPEQTQALTQAERAGFLRGLGVAARVLRDHHFIGLAEFVEARDGRQGADVREHCAGGAQS